jgi:hypothetical protein
MYFKRLPMQTGLAISLIEFLFNNLLMSVPHFFDQATYRNCRAGLISMEFKRVGNRKPPRDKVLTPYPGRMIQLLALVYGEGVGSLGHHGNLGVFGPAGLIGQLERLIHAGGTGLTAAFLASSAFSGLVSRMMAAQIGVLPLAHRHPARDQVVARTAFSISTRSSILNQSKTRRAQRCPGTRPG